jgi:hypothetical protein
MKNVKCTKCLIEIPSSNFYLHESICKGLTNNIIKCRKCNINLSHKEVGDHMFSHDLEDLQSQDRIQLNNRQYAIQNNNRNQYNHILSRRTLINSHMIRRQLHRNIRQDSFENLESYQSNMFERNRRNNILRLINELLYEDEIRTGIDEETKRSLPESVLKNVKKLPEEKKNCVICMEEFGDNDVILTVPCYHIFHQSCVMEWFKIENTCPICKPVT